MAGHADLGGRHPRERRILNRIVAISAVDPQPAHMMLMAERDRLGPRVALASHVGRSLNIPPNQSGARRQRNGAEKRRLGERVHRWMKELRHTVRSRKPSTLGPMAVNLCADLISMQWEIFRKFKKCGIPWDRKREPRMAQRRLRRQSEGLAQ